MHCRLIGPVGRMEDGGWRMENGEWRIEHRGSVHGLPQCRHRLGRPPAASPRRSTLGGPRGSGGLRILAPRGDHRAVRIGPRWPSTSRHRQDQSIIRHFSISHMPITPSLDFNRSFHFLSGISSLWTESTSSEISHCLGRHPARYVR